MTDLTATYYAQRASAGLIITEGTQPSVMGQGYPGTPGLHSQQQVRRRFRIASTSKHYDGAMAYALNPAQMRTYFAVTEAVSLLQYAVRQQLQAEGGLSYVQFEILAKLAAAEGRQLTMTDLADGVVYSRSGLTHQAGLLETEGLITRHASSDDQRATVVDITEAGRARVAKVLPGHIHVVRDLLFDSLSDRDVRTLGDMMSRARDHMRARPPRSAAPRKRTKESTEGLGV